MSVLAFSLAIGLLVGLLRKAGGIICGSFAFGAVLTAAMIATGISQSILLAAMAVGAFNSGLFFIVFLPLFARRGVRA